MPIVAISGGRLKSAVFGSGSDSSLAPLIIVSVIKKGQRCKAGRE